MFLNVRSVLLCVGYYAKQSKWNQTYHKLPITDEEREGERKRQRKRKTKRKIKRKRQVDEKKACCGDNQKHGRAFVEPL